MPKSDAGKKLKLPRKSAAKKLVKPIKKPRSLESYKLVYFRRLNDIHIAAQVSRDALGLYERELKARRDKANASLFHHFVVPSGGKPTARIRRERHEMQKLIQRLLDGGEHRKSLVMAVSITEDYILNVLKLVLRAHPERLARGLRGGDSDSAIKLEEFIRKCRDEILEERIRTRLYATLYASPAEYLAYLAAALEVGIDNEAVNAFIEAKASRDVIIHANGRANDKYVEKAGTRGRAAAGEELPVNEGYFDACIGTMKALIGDVHDKVCARYRHDEKVLQCADRFLD